MAAMISCRARESGAFETRAQPLRMKQKEDSNDKESHSDMTWDEWVQRMDVGDENNPGIAIGWANDATLHACLGVAGAPIPQGANPAASGAAMRAWFLGVVVAINPNSAVRLTGGIPSPMFFHHLTLTEYGDIVQALHANPFIVWAPALLAAGLSAGTFYMVTAGGRGRNDVMLQRFVPFL